MSGLFILVGLLALLRRPALSICRLGVTSRSRLSVRTTSPLRSSIAAADDPDVAWFSNRSTVSLGVASPEDRPRRDADDPSLLLPLLLPSECSLSEESRSPSSNWLASPSSMTRSYDAADRPPPPKSLCVSPDR